MKTIKFSHKYEKMPDGYNYSELIDIIPIKLEDMSETFRRYDTKIQGSDEFYPLPDHGDYIILLLLSQFNCLWTTIRRSTPSKLEYYKDSIGEVFRCEVIE